MTITFMNHQIARDGYGYAAIKISEALKRIAPEAKVIDMLEGRDKFSKTDHGRSWYVQGTAVAMCVPEWLPDLHADNLISYTMFEATQMPSHKVELINRYASQCLVPCQWCADMFRENGVTVPLSVVPWGIDTADYWPLDRLRCEDDPYTFLWSGTGDLRKGWDVAYTAFKRVFGKSKEVRLILHFRNMPEGVTGFRDENVEVVTGLLDRPELRALLERADCFVFPSRGEGWGLPPREAAATGLPVLTTDWSGLSEEIEHWALPIRVKQLKPATFYVWSAGDVGLWAEPDADHLMALMQDCFIRQSPAASFGSSAAQWLAQNTPWERTAKALLTVTEGVFA